MHTRIKKGRSVLTLDQICHKRAYAESQPGTLKKKEFSKSCDFHNIKKLKKKLKSAIKARNTKVGKFSTRLTVDLTDFKTWTFKKGIFFSYWQLFSTLFRMSFFGAAHGWGLHFDTYF